MCFAAAMHAWLHSQPSAIDELQTARSLTIATMVQSDYLILSCDSLVSQHMGDSLLVAPTGAGKTGHAVAFANEVLLSNKTVLCIAPYHTLISELSARMQFAFEGRGFQVGCLDSLIPAEARKLDICLGTPEQALKLLLQPAACTRLGGIIMDEVHHAMECGARADRLQALLQCVKAARDSTGGHSRVRLLGLTATIQSQIALNFATWYPCSLVYCCQRAVPLHVGNLQQGCVQPIVQAPHLPARSPSAAAHEPRNSHHADAKHSAQSAPTKGMLSHIVRRVRRGARVVLFVPSRAACEQLAHALSQQLPPAAVSYHHAGSSQQHRDSALRGFCTGTVSALVATTTLAMGVNLPATDVVVLGRQSQAQGHEHYEHRQWSLLQQQAGRAGRWGLQKHGRCVLVGPMADCTVLAFAHPLTPLSWQHTSTSAIQHRELYWHAAESLLLYMHNNRKPVAAAGCLATVRCGWLFATASTRECGVHLAHALCVLRACDFVDVHHEASRGGAVPHSQVHFTLSQAGIAAAEALPVCPLQDFIGIVQFVCASAPPQILPLDQAVPERRLAMLLGNTPSSSSDSDSAFALAPLRRIAKSFDWQVLRTWLALMPRPVTA